MKPNESQPQQRHDDEPKRLSSLRALGILDTLPEERFDRYTRLAQRLFGVPMAAVSLVDAHRQWFKSRQGIATKETSRDVAFCAHTIRASRVLVVSDAMADDRFAENPLVLAEPNIRFYAGRPLRTPDGQALGTFCILDSKPRVLTPRDIEALEDLAGLVELELVMLQEATTDSLTGLSNRRGFETIAEQLLVACQRQGAEAIMVFIDLDRFKSINDTHGHDAGDQALQDAAALLKSVFRAADLIGRVGGDEFCVLCVDTGNTEAVLRRLDAAFAEYNALDGAWELHFSAGVVRYDPDRHTCVEDLLSSSDRAMYAAKRTRE